MQSTQQTLTLTEATTPEDFDTQSRIKRGQPRQLAFNWEKNGQDWGENEKFPLCKDGCKQSPIDIDFGTC
jgi:carbonic anhydrase